MVEEGSELEEKQLNKLLWDLSIILGRTYGETRESYENLEKGHLEHNTNNGLFNIIYSIGKRMVSSLEHGDDMLSIHFTPSLQELIGHQRYSALWSQVIRDKLVEKGLQNRPLHIISANMHSVKNVLYGAAALAKNKIEVAANMYDMVSENRDKNDLIDSYALEHGCIFLPDHSGSNIDVQIIDVALAEPASFHPKCKFDEMFIQQEKPVILVMDYAFGAQAFELMDELLTPSMVGGSLLSLNVQSISVMGKAGILPGNKGDIMLANAHIMEGSADNYVVENDLATEDFEGKIDCYTGPMLTVLGTSLQNRDLLERFHKSSWKAVGLEMEGGHYQRAISAAMIQEHIDVTVKTRYAYYASDNPLKSGETLAAGPMGDDGIVPTYKITKVILQKILNPSQ